MRREGVERKVLMACGLSPDRPLSCSASSDAQQSEHSSPHATFPDIYSVKESPLYGRSYQYEKLTHVKSSIRLIRIQPGSCSDPLVCGLEITDLHNDSTSYEAFSYAWGDTTTKVHIECDGRDLWITRNLRDALFRVRLDDCVRVVWADAISINQDDVEERGHQVSLMRRIY